MSASLTELIATRRNLAAERATTLAEQIESGDSRSVARQAEIEQALADISERLDALGALTIRVALALNLPDEEEDTEAAAQGAEEAAEQPDSQPERSAPASRGRRKAAQAQ